jgi:serine protease
MQGFSELQPTMNRRTWTLLAAILLAAPCASAASARAAIGVSPAREFKPHRVIVKLKSQRLSRAVKLPDGVGVHSAVAFLRDQSGVAYAAPDYIATASGAPPVDEVAPSLPNDPGPLVGSGVPVPGGWVWKQWNFLPWEGVSTPLRPTSPGGIDAVDAWQHLVEAKRPGALGITVAVLDTGIAYRSKGRRFRRSPDFTAGQFVKGYDFVANDRLPLDHNGHGTHVAGTIAEKTNNGIGLTGLAYRARLMPVRVLNSKGQGDASNIAKGIRFAVAHGANVINMSFNFGCGKEVPGVDEALRQAFRKGVVTVASVGNLGSETCVSAPATGPHVIGVGGSTEGGCLGNYSLAGKDVDLLAPGGGAPTACESVLFDPIYQVTLKNHNPRRFGEPSDYIGTSMAAAHVSGAAAMVLASDTLRNKPRGGALVNEVFLRLASTARSIGLPKTQQGYGLIDVGLATDPECQIPCQAHHVHDR